MAITEIASGLKFPEGPVVMEDGSVIVVEIQSGNITRVKPNGKKQVIASPGGGPNGAAIGPDGALYVCNNGGFAWGELDGMLIPGNAASDYTTGRIERIDLKAFQAATVGVYEKWSASPVGSYVREVVYAARGGQ